MPDGAASPVALSGPSICLRHQGRIVPRLEGVIDKGIPKRANPAERRWECVTVGILDLPIAPAWLGGFSEDATGRQSAGQLDPLIVQGLGPGLGAGRPRPGLADIS